MREMMRPLATVALLFIAAFWLMPYLASLTNPPVSQITLEYSDLLKQIESGNIKRIEINSGGKISGEFKIPIPDTAGNKATFVSEVFDQPSMEWVQSLSAKVREKNGNARINIVSLKPSPFWTFVLTWGPTILMIGFFLIIMGNFASQQGSVGGPLGSFTRSRARLFSKDTDKKTFQDVAGVDEAKEDLQELIEFLKNPLKFTKLGGRIPRGVLLVGPPGTGKTLLAKAVAGEANVPFFSVSGSDFVEMFVGVGASRVRDLFEQGHKNAPCIIFIDELDTVGQNRSAGVTTHQEHDQTLNQLLSEMDGFETDAGVIILAATNRPEVLDPALLRPGRFDRQVMVERPDVKGRQEILKIHVRNKPIEDNIDLGIVARGTPGFVGADLANLVNEAALSAAGHGHDKISQADFEWARDKVLMGRERSLIISDKEKKVIAYHEAGHALVAALLPKADPLHKVTIIPHGIALGLTQQLPIDDKHNYSKTDLTSMLAILMGGRASEEIVFGDITTGAGNDIERATDLARKMVCIWGMSELGPLKFGSQTENQFLGRRLLETDVNYSDESAREVDTAIKKFIEQAYNRASDLICSHLQALEKIAELLTERETLTGEEVMKIVKEAH